MKELNLDWLNIAPNELDLEIGRALVKDEFGSKPLTDEEARTVGERWFQTNLARFRGAVCGLELVQAQFLPADSQKRNELFAAVVDALMKAAGWGQVPVAVLGARLLHFGLGRLCTVPSLPSKA